MSKLNIYNLPMDSSRMVEVLKKVFKDGFKIVSNDRQKKSDPVTVVYSGRLYLGGFPRDVLLEDSLSLSDQTLLASGQKIEIAVGEEKIQMQLEPEDQE